MTRNLTMMTDLYQLTMMYGYHKSGMTKQVATFDMFYRRQSETMYNAVFAGLEQLIDFINELRFEDDDIAYLRSLKLFDEEFLASLKRFKFSGDIDAVPEGTIVFPGQPLIRVRAPISEAQLIETALLNIVNHQTLIASKARRVVAAADGEVTLEFGLRRAQGPDAGIYGARAAVIAGFTATSNVLAGEMFDIPVMGTHAHSWVMSFPDELSAFMAYAQHFPNSCTLLVDTYDTIKSGVPNAIAAFKWLRERGHEPKSIRLDSGDLAYLSREARRMLDAEGFPGVKICASGDLDEQIIRDLKLQGACIDIWGVGTKLITSMDCPALGGVYKLCAIETDGMVSPKLKVSDNPEKLTDPGIKKLLRIYDVATGKATADLTALEQEEFDESVPLTIFDPVNTWKQMTLTDYRIRPLHVPIFRGGEQVYQTPSLPQIVAYHKQEIESFWDQHLRLLNPHHYKVDLSDKLWTLRQSMLSTRLGNR